MKWKNSEGHVVLHMTNMKNDKTYHIFQIMKD